MAEELTKDDLVILMESYRNMITMHQTILSQINQTIDKLETISTKQDSLSIKQDSLSTKQNTTDTKIEGNNTKIDIFEKRTIGDHARIINKIHLGWIGMATIILGLIGLGATIMNVINSVPK